jgi:hypothetical protein
MELELKEWLGKGMLVYLDDIIIYAKTIEEHNKLIMALLNRLKQRKLKINPEKMQLCKNQVKLLGIIVDGDTVSMPEEMKVKIFEFKIPENKKDLQRFLGAVNYQRRFIDNLGEKTRILYDILKADRTMKDWTEEHTKAFKKIQAEANQEVKRFHPDYDKIMFLETDASNEGIGAILFQFDGKGNKQIIKPIAAKLKPAEINWGITEKEVYAIVWAVEKLEMYLVGKKFHIITDHKAAAWLRTKDDFGNKRIARWMERLEYFDFTIEYRKGDEMYEADALSRMFMKNEKTQMKEQQEKIIREQHEECGHRGVDVTEYAVRKNYTKWDNQKIHIKEVIDNCEICIRNKTKCKGGAVFVETERKMQKMGVDILEHKENYILVGIDYYTRFIFAAMIKTKSAESIVNILSYWFRTYGNPEEIIADKGLEFCNAKVEELCFNRNIKMHITATAHHESNGRVERVNRTLREYFRKDDAEKFSLEEMVGRAVARYNESLHSAIKISPNEAWRCSEASDLKIRNKKDSPYAKSFRKTNRDKFVKGQIVAVKELPYHKENQKFGGSGKVMEKLDHDSYLVKVGNKIEKRNHRDLNLIT